MDLSKCPSVFDSRRKKVQESMIIAKNQTLVNMCSIDYSYKFLTDACVYRP